MLALAVLLAAAATVLVVEAIGDSETIDEFAHLPAGVYYLRTGHFDFAVRKQSMQPSDTNNQTTLSSTEHCGSDGALR